MTKTKSLQCRDFTWALHMEKSISPLFPGPQGDVVANDWCINDMPECVKSQIRLFADDCLLYRTIKNFGDHVKLQQDLNNLIIWAEK